MMISLFFIIIIMLALVFSILAFADRDEVAWSVIAVPAWFVAAILTHSLEWQVAVSSGDSVTVHTVTYSGGWPLSIFFMLLAFVFILFTWNRVLRYLRGGGR